MKRDIVSAYLGQRLLAYTYNCNSTTPVNITSPDEGTFSKPASAVSQLVKRTAYNEIPCVVCCGGEDITTGGQVSLQANPTTTTLKMDGFVSGGGDDHGYHNVIAVGPVRDDNDHYDYVHPVTCTRKRARLMGLSVSAAGDILIGAGDFSVVKNGTGDYSITLLKPASDLVVPVVMGGASAAVGARTDNVTASGFDYETYTAAGSAADRGINAIVVAYDTIEHGVSDGGGSLYGTQVKGRLETYIVNYTAGTPAFISGGDGASLTDHGLGDLTITFDKPFKRTPVVVASTVGAFRTFYYTSAADAVRVRVCDLAGTLADPTGYLCVMVLGSDEATEY